MSSRSSLRTSPRVSPRSTALIVPALLSAAAILSYVEYAEAATANLRARSNWAGFSLSPRIAGAPDASPRAWAAAINPAPPAKAPENPPAEQNPPAGSAPEGNAPGENDPQRVPPEGAAPEGDAPEGAAPEDGAEEIQPDAAPPRAQPDAGSNPPPQEGAPKPEETPKEDSGAAADEGEVQMEFGDESQPEEGDEGEVQMEFGEEAPAEGEAQPGQPEEGDEGEVQMEFGEASPDEDQTPPDDDDGGGFVFEDISDDPEALAKELQAGQKQAKGVVGTVKGVITGSDGQPVMGAYIETSDGKFVARAGVDGSYALKLNPGTYTLRVRFDGYESKDVPGIVVAARQDVDLDTQITPLPGAVQTLIVEEEVAKEGQVGQAIQRQKSRAARDIMSRDEMSRSGGSSTSSVARRIVGSTIVGGRYIFVRGLGHRYGNTLMDGARVPSPDPELRTVPLDIFPTSALSAINVQKTATADVPADFTGGSVQLETRDIPDYFTFKIGASIGGNTQTTFLPMITHRGYGGADFWGFGNLKRALPDEVANAKVKINDSPFKNTGKPAYTPAQREKFGESLPLNTRITDKDVYAPANLSADLSLGNSWDFGKSGEFGALMAAGYRNQHSTKRGILKLFGMADGKLETSTPKVDYETLETSNEVAWNAIGLAKLKLDDYHKLSLVGMYSRDVDDSTRRFTGEALSVEGDLLVADRLRYTMRSILSTRLGGKHLFPAAKDLKVEWFGVYANARRDDPGIRDVVLRDKRREPAGKLIFDHGTAPPEYTFLKLDDHTSNAALDISLPFPQWTQLESLFKIGGWFETKSRTFQARGFTYKAHDETRDIVDNMDLTKEELLTPETVGVRKTATTPTTGLFEVEENTEPTSNYRATQHLFAGYLLVDLPITYQVKVSAGARLEHNLLRVSPDDIFATEEEKAKPADPSKKDLNSRLKNLDVLPSLSLQYNPIEKMALRLVGTQTLARPEMRELAPFEFTDFVGGWDISGNPHLEQTKIWNVDLRWEWFPEPGDVVSATLFFKHFDKPIESAIGNRSGQSLASFVNAKYARNFGFELEGRKNLGFIRPILRPWTLGANFAYVKSKVVLIDRLQLCDPAALEGDMSLSPAEKKRKKEKCIFLASYDASTSRERPLQGQSPFVLNLFLDFSHKKWGTNARVLYNTFGRRIFRIGGGGQPDMYEEGVHSVDLRLEQAIYRVPEVIDDEGNIKAPAKALKLKFSVNNLFNAPVRFTQGEEKVLSRRTTKGVGFSLGMDWSF